jgi:quercetin dioxygenase-like cupin family protein
MGSAQFIIADDIETMAVPFGSVRRLVHPGGMQAEQLVILEGSVKPGQGHDFHKHPGQEEVIYVLSGKIEQWLEKEKRILGPGDSVFIPAGVVHASFNAGTDDARILAIFGPSVGEGFETIEMADTSPWKDLRAA